MHVKKSVSVVKFPDGPPLRSLDLGCGVSHILHHLLQLRDEELHFPMFEGGNLGTGSRKGMARVSIRTPFLVSKPNLEFTGATKVGFDLVDVQIPLSMLDPDVATRIMWVHGNL